MDGTTNLASHGGADSFVEVSPWISPPCDIRPPATGVLDTGIAIVGGGYTGLSAAIRLKELGHDVILVERHFCGFGASGRNAGHLTPTIGKDIHTCLRLYGEKRGLELVRFGELAVRFVEQAIGEHRIDCDYQPVGNIIAGVHPSQRTKLVRATQVAENHGLNAHFVDEQEMRDRALPRSFLFGIHETIGGYLDPGKYVAGLRHAAIDAGVELYEQTQVTNIERGSVVALRSDRATIKARKVLIASNAFTPSLGLLRRNLAPLAVSLFQTPPLTAEQLDCIGWHKKEGIYTAHESLENFRLTADNRILGGSKYVRYGFGSILPPANDPETFERLGTMFRARFRELPDVGIESFWSGWIALTSDFLPLCGTVKGKRNIYYSLGYNGHGIAQASMMGAAMAEYMIGHESPVRRLLDRRALPFPPEPFRWLAVRGLLSVLAGLDRRLDRKIAKEARNV